MESEGRHVETLARMHSDNAEFCLSDVLRRRCYVPIGITAAEITEEDIRLAEALVIPEFDPHELAMADSILAGTWYGDWDGLESPWEWAVDLKRRWLEKVAENG